MDIPYGFDCYAFQKEEIKYFEKDSFSVRKSILSREMATGGGKDSSSFVFLGERQQQQQQQQQLAQWAQAMDTTTDGLADHVKFTRKNEDYPQNQLQALARANRLNLSELDKRIFCGIKIQLGIGVVTSFLRKGLQYKPPIWGRSELVNGSWTGIMKGLTVRKDSPLSYDLAFGNFLAWDEEFPFIKFGPFFAIESKLVMLTGSSRRIESSSFGTNINGEIWTTILVSLLLLSLLASLRIHWQATKYSILEQALDEIFYSNNKAHLIDRKKVADNESQESIVANLTNFFFIYITMLLNKPSHEFDELVWPKAERARRHHRVRKPSTSLNPIAQLEALREREKLLLFLEANKSIKQHYEHMLDWKLRKREARCRLPTTIRIVSYMWSAACLVITSIYSGEMLAVMLLHTDTNVDTISQLINAKPPIEPVIRQDDFTYNLMLKSLDENMLKLHSRTRIIPRQEVYTRQFIESVSQRKVALLGDDELIETIYDLYHKYYPLHKSKMSYLQYPISLMYRKDLNSSLETNLRRGLVQMFEMGLVHRWYQAQKDTYIQFYDNYERKSNEKSTSTSALDLGSTNTKAEQKYKPLSIAQFASFFRAMLYCIVFAFIVLVMEIAHEKFR